MYDPNNKKAVDQRAKRERLDQVRAADDLRAIMQTPEGRRFMHGLLGLCGLRESAWRPGDASAQRQQDYVLGRQSVGLEVLQAVEAHAGPLAEQMMAEARQAEAERKATEEAEDMTVEQEQADG